MVDFRTNTVSKHFASLSFGLAFVAAFLVTDFNSLRAQATFPQPGGIATAGVYDKMVSWFNPEAVVCANCSITTTAPSVIGPVLTFAGSGAVEKRATPSINFNSFVKTSNAGYL